MTFYQTVIHIHLEQTSEVGYQVLYPIIILQLLQDDIYDVVREWDLCHFQISPQERIYKRERSTSDCLGNSKGFSQARHSSGCLNGKASPLSIAAICMFSSLSSADDNVYSSSVCGRHNMTGSLTVKVMAYSSCDNTTEGHRFHRRGCLLLSLQGRGGEEEEEGGGVSTDYPISWPYSRLAYAVLLS